MTKTDSSLRQNLRKALGALEHEHAAEMLSPRQKRYILDMDEQAKMTLPGHSQALTFMQRILSRVNFIGNPVAILKNRVVRLRAYSSR
jgi:hypothetical protein